MITKKMKFRILKKRKSRKNNCFVEIYNIPDKEGNNQQSHIYMKNRLYNQWLSLEINIQIIF